MEKRSFKERLFNEYIGKTFATLCGMLIIAVTLSIIIFIGQKGIQTFTKGNYGIVEFLFTNNWNPSETPASFGALAFILGSTFVSMGAVIISAPIAITLAVFVNVISKGLGNKLIKPSLEILVGICCLRVGRDICISTFYKESYRWNGIFIACRYISIILNDITNYSNIIY